MKAAFWALVAGSLVLSGCGGGGSGDEIVSGVRFTAGPVNTLAVAAGGSRVVFYGDPSGAPADAVLFTHHRRDVVWAGRPQADAGAETYGPASERELFEEPQAYWEGFRTARFHDYAQQSTKVLTAPLELKQEVRGGQTLQFGSDLSVEVLDTSGYTRGSVSYLFERGGKRIAVTGDLIYDGGKIFDLYSLQDAIPEANVRGYHGYAARAANVINSLRELAVRKPDVIVPARGPIINDPQEAIGQLIARLQELFRNYYRTDALRWYWGDDNLKLRARRVLSDVEPEWMPMANELREIPPRWMHKFNTSRLIVSDDGPAFLIDCGTDQVMEQIEELRKRGVFTTLEGIFVTHYHDDHTDRVQAMAEKYRAPVYAGPETVDILERPAAYHMPAETDRPIRDIRAFKEGEKMDWHEYSFTYTYFPGQAIYHGGLKLERKDGEKFFFVGDSFSPSGLDDYCLLNRHFLHPGWGHYRCIKIIRESDPKFWLVNQHIEPTFRYGPEQLDVMEQTLEAKRQAVAELVPWEDPNFGLDEQWVRLYPYGVTPAAGDKVEMWAVVFNHASEPKTVRITPNVPKGWKQPAPFEFTVAPLTEQRASFELEIPPDASGLKIVTADVDFAGRTLKQWVEAMVEIGAPAR